MFESPASRRGFGAAEVLVATAILGIALAPVLSLFPSGSRQAIQSGLHVQAQAMAEAALRDWETRAIAGKFESAWPADFSSAASAAETQPIRLELTAEEIEGKEGLWRVAVRAEWTAPAGAHGGELLVEQLFARPGLSLIADYPLVTRAKRKESDPA